VLSGVPECEGTDSTHLLTRLHKKEGCVLGPKDLDKHAYGEFNHIKSKKQLRGRLLDFLSFVLHPILAGGARCLFRSYSA
jgi:hypothetical protein